MADIPCQLDKDYKLLEKWTSVTFKIYLLQVNSSPSVLLESISLFTNIYLSVFPVSIFFFFWSCQVLRSDKD